MNCLHLSIPDLFLPRDIAPHAFAGLRLPALEKLLGRSVQSVLPAMTVEDYLCAQFKARAVAPVRAAADGLDTGDGFWMCADPVNLQLQQSQVVLQPDVQCNTGEAAALCATLNAYFANDGLVFFVPNPQRWYVRSAAVTDVTMTPLRLAAWRDVKPCQPQGVDALRWQRVANEIQMLLHDHAVNQAREAKGLPVINSVWLWGGGSASMLQSAFDVVGGDDALGAAFACASGVPVVASPAAMLDMQGQHGLWVCTALGEAWQRGDLYAWREAMRTVEREIAQPVWQAIRAGRLRAVTLDVLLEFSTQRFDLDRSGLWKVWRRPCPLENYSV